MNSRGTVAVIDVGSNSIKLLVAKRGPAADHIETVLGETIETRISAGIGGALPSLTDHAMASGCQTITELLHLARDFHPDEIQIVATSAVRDAINSLDFVAMVEHATRIEMRVLSGTEEAIYIGKGLACDPQIEDIDGFVQMDIGGGSLELIRFHRGQIEQAISLKLGAVRLTERFIKDRDAPIEPNIEAAIQTYVTKLLNESDFSFGERITPLIVTGGAFVITRAILAAGANETIEERSPVLQKSEISQLKLELMALPLNERLSLPHLPAARADIVPTALITIEAVLDLAGRDAVTHSFFNLRYGIAAELLAPRKNSQKTDARDQP